MPTRSIPLALTVLALGLGACGGDEDEVTIPPPTTVAGPTGATGATGEAGAGLPSPATAGEISSCLSDAGIEVTPSDSEVAGVEGTYERLDIALGDLAQGGLVVVFESEQDAEAQEPNVEAGGGISQVEVTGNAVWGIDAAAGESEQERASIEGCMPSG
jgi:hypothetical protein